MLTPLRFLRLLLLALSLGFAQSAQASHALGGSITYTSLGNNRYLVRCDLFRDCSGIIPSSTLTLNCRTACSGGTFLTGTMVQVGQPFVGTPYSSSIQPLVLCTPTTSNNSLYPNFVAHRYEATVTLPANQWTLSIIESARPVIANLAAQGNLRLEATLDNRVLTNNSAVFSNLPVFFVPHLQPNLLHIGAYDADGDSLAYSLVRPLGDCATYETYAAYPLQCQTGVISTAPACLLTCPFTGTTPIYSAGLPISVMLDTVGTCPTKTAVPHFEFDATSGALYFTPNRFIPGNSSLGQNKYVVDVQVTEWRKVGGIYRVVGTTRRDMVWVVYDGTNAARPRLSPTLTVQTGTQTTTQSVNTPVPVHVGEPVSVNFVATSPLPGSVLSFTLEQNTVPGAVINSFLGRLTFTPPLGLRDGIYNVSLTVTDDASPLRNMVTVPIAFRVYSTALATRKAVLISPAYPNPFTERVQFQLAQAGVQSLSICDQLGRVVATVRSQADGRVQWEPGADVPAGLYLARTEDGRQSIRLMRSDRK